MTCHTVFCSACDRNVSLIPRSADWTWHIVLDKEGVGEVACLERVGRCTGTLCPFSAVVPDGGDLAEANRASDPAAN